MRRFAWGIVLPALLLAATPASGAGMKMATAAKTKPDRMKAADLRAEMRKLWEDHVAYTAFFYKAAIRGEDTDAIAERLLRNQDDLGNAVKPFYGEEAGNKLAALLRDHILIAADVVKAAKAGDSAALAAANKRWHQNGDDIAAFLASANPNWDRKALQDALSMHLDGVTEQVVAGLHKDAAAEIVAYDRNREHMLAVADILSAGIVKQFPKRFVA